MVNQAALEHSPHIQQDMQPGQDSWMARFAMSYHAAEDFTAFALVARAAEDKTADIFPHTLFGAARLLLLRLLQVIHWLGHAEVLQQCCKRQN